MAAEVERSVYQGGLAPHLGESFLDHRVSSLPLGLLSLWPGREKPPYPHLAVIPLRPGAYSRRNRVPRQLTRGIAGPPNLALVSEPFGSIGSIDDAVAAGCRARPELYIYHPGSTRSFRSRRTTSVLPLFLLSTNSSSTRRASSIFNT